MASLLLAGALLGELMLVAVAGLFLFFVFVPLRCCTQFSFLKNSSQEKKKKNSFVLPSVTWKVPGRNTAWTITFPTPQRSTNHQLKYSVFPVPLHSVFQALSPGENSGFPWQKLTDLLPFLTVFSSLTCEELWCFIFPRWAGRDYAGKLLIEILGKKTAINELSLGTMLTSLIYLEHSK